MARKPTDTVQLKLRFPERLRRLLKEAAKDHKQSMNAEIVKRLDDSFLRQNLAALMREHVNNAAEAAAEAAAEKVVQKLKEGSSK